MNDSVALRAISDNSVFFNFLAPSVRFGAGRLGGFIGNDVEELLLRLDEVLHALASEVHHVLGLVRLAGFRGLHPGVGLFVGNLQKLLLHVDEGVYAAPQQVDGGMAPRAVTNPFLHSIHQDFVLLLAQVKKHLLSFEKVIHACARHFAHDRRGRMIRVGELLPQDVHDVRILPHRQIEQDALGGEESLYPLLRPSGNQGDHGLVFNMSGFMLCYCHMKASNCCTAASTKLYEDKELVSRCCYVLVHSNIGRSPMQPSVIIIKKYGNRRLYDTAGSRYVNLDDLAALVRKGQEVRVVDAKTGRDLTRVTLTQIITEDAKDKPTGLPLELLRQLVIASDEVRQEFLMWYLKSAFDTYEKVQDAVQNRLSEVQSAILSPVDVMKTRAGHVSGAGCRRARKWTLCASGWRNSRRKLESRHSPEASAHQTQGLIPQESSWLLPEKVPKRRAEGIIRAAMLESH